MAQKYLIEGKLTTTKTAIAAGRRFEDLRVVAYQPSGPHGLVHSFGSCSVDAKGNFKLEFEHGAVGSSPLDMYTMPLPEVLEPFVGSIEMSYLGSFFPKIHIPAGKWVLTSKVYTTSVSINIPDGIWGQWDWLSEEFTIIGQVKKQVGETLLPVPFAVVKALDVDIPEPYEDLGDAQTDERGNFTIAFRRIRFFVNYAHYYPLIGRYAIEDWPDPIFSVYQDPLLTLLWEDPDAARPRSMWNEPHRMLNVTLVTGEGITFDDELLPIPAGDNFLFHGIGVVDPHSFTDGYATTGPGDDLPNRQDCPFGSWLNIKGQFDTTTPKNAPKYYQVLYAKWEGSTAPDDIEFEPIQHESWTVSKCDLTTYDWEPLVIEPISDVIPGQKVYEIPDYTDITRTKKTRLIRWTTHRKDAGVRRYPDGKYDLLIKAWDASGNTVVLNPSHPENNRLTVVIDNKRPKALLRAIGGHNILRTDEMHPYTPVCPVFSKGPPSPPNLPTILDVTFEATDDHFRTYRLSFITGHNFYVDETIKYYDGKTGTDDDERFNVTEHHKTIQTGAVTPTHPPDQVIPPGGFPDDVIGWDISSPDVVPCAYQVRLRVSDRTINGYGYIHYTEDTMHFSIEE
jgi:hypothetical protein